MLKYFKERRGLVNVLLLSFVFGLGVFIGFHSIPEINKVVNIEGKETAVDTTVDFSPFWRVWNDINEKYPSNDEVTDQNKLYGAISGLVNSLEDPYSVFFNPEETKLFEEDIKGSFSGIGIEIGIKDKILTVIAPLRDTPAWRADMKSGDKILKIDETLTNGMSVDEAIKLIRGEEGTSVSLTIFHE